MKTLNTKTISLLIPIALFFLMPAISLSAAHDDAKINNQDAVTAETLNKVYNLIENKDIYNVARILDANKDNIDTIKGIVGLIDKTDPKIASAIFEQADIIAIERNRGHQKETFEQNVMVSAADLIALVRLMGKTATKTQAEHNNTLTAASSKTAVATEHALNFNTSDQLGGLNDTAELPTDMNEKIDRNFNSSLTFSREIRLSVEKISPN